MCGEANVVTTDSELGRTIAAALLADQWDELGLQPLNAPIIIDGVEHEVWVAVIGWFDRSQIGPTLFVGRPVEDGWAFDRVWDRFGADQERIVGQLQQMFPEAPAALSFIDTTTGFREQ